MNIYELVKLMPDYDQRELLTLKRWINLLLEDETRFSISKNQIHLGQAVTFFQTSARGKIRQGHVARMHDEWVDVHHRGLQFTMPYFSVFQCDYARKPMRKDIVHRPATHHFKALYEIGMIVAVTNKINHDLYFGRVVQIDETKVGVQIGQQSYLLPFSEVRQVHNALSYEESLY